MIRLPRHPETHGTTDGVRLPLFHLTVRRGGNYYVLLCASSQSSSAMVVEGFVAILHGGCAV